MATKTGLAYRRPGSPVNYMGFNRFPALEAAGIIISKAGAIATACSTAEATWRSAMYAALEQEVGNEYAHPRDAKDDGHYWLVGDRIYVGLAEKVHGVTITRAFEWGGRLRYRFEFQNGFELVATQRQLVKLMDRRAGEFAPLRAGM